MIFLKRLCHVELESIRIELFKWSEHWTAITTAQIKNVVDLYFSRCHTASHRVNFGKANESCRRSMFTSANGNRGCGLTDLLILPNGIPADIFPRFALHTQ